MSPRYAMTMDTRRCVGCNACVYACKQENDLPEGAFRDWITTTVRGVFPDLSAEIHSERCNHCDDAPCVYACPTGASHFSEGGIVLVNHDKCTGCKACIASCPYDARYVHPDGYVDKCTFCAHRTTEGLDPACVSVCPTESLAFGDLTNKESIVSRLLRARTSKTLRPETGTGPNVYFLS